MNFSSQDAAYALLSLGLGPHTGVGFGLGIALGSEVESDGLHLGVDWVSDSEQPVFLNTTESDNLSFNNTRDDYDR